MLRVRWDLCRGCGICVESCPQQAIAIVSATAQINQERCNQCRLCLDVCPQGAITEVAPVSGHELQAIVTGLKDKAEDVIVRIERLKEQQRLTGRFESGGASGSQAYNAYIVEILCPKINEIKYIDQEIVNITTRRNNSNA